MSDAERKNPTNLEALQRPEKKVVTLEVIDLPVESLYQTEPQVVSERVIDALSPKFDPYRFPIIIWDNPQRYYRVVDGFHRLFTAKRLGLSGIRCQIENYTETEFWAQRLAFTREHEKIAGHRMVSWLADLWTELPTSKRIDVNELFRTMKSVEAGSLIELHGTLRKHGLSNHEVETAIQFVQKYREILGLSFGVISDYLTDISLIGKDNLYILGLNEVTPTKLRMFANVLLKDMFGMPRRELIGEAMKVVNKHNLSRVAAEILAQGLKQAATQEEIEKILRSGEPLKMITAIRVEREIKARQKTELQINQPSIESEG